MRMRWLWTTMAVFGLVAASVVALPSAPAESAIGDFGTSTGSGSAVVANAGDGRYKDRIVWTNWGTAGSSLTGKSVTTWQQVGATTRVEVTCTLSNISGGTLNVYRPGTWAPDGFTRLYRTSDATNNLVSGIGITDNGDVVSFRVVCGTANLVTYTDTTFTTAASTDAISLAGIVIADAEATNGSEYVYATPTTTGATWRVIDAYAGTCSSTYQGRVVAASNQLQLTSSGECSSPGYSATAVLVADGSTGANFTVYGSGLAAVSVGYVLGVDYGDAPASYGVAGGVVQPTWNGGTLSTTNQSIVTGGAW